MHHYCAVKALVQERMMVLQIAALQDQLGSASAQLQDSTAQATLLQQDLTEARTAADGTSDALSRWSSRCVGVTSIRLL